MTQTTCIRYAHGTTASHRPNHRLDAAPHRFGHFTPLFDEQFQDSPEFGLIMQGGL